MIAILMKGSLAGLVCGHLAAQNKNQPMCAQLNSMQQRFVPVARDWIHMRAPGNKSKVITFTTGLLA
jgi:hypothetical protein